MEGDIDDLNKYLGLEKLQLIDISSEDDFLIDSQLCDSFQGFCLSELQSSAESNCAKSSNSFESHEIDLFKGPRESNQKSRIISLMESSRPASGKGDTTKKLEVAPWNMRNARSRESNSTSLRPPKFSGRSKPIAATPTKRASFGDDVPEHMMASKKPCLGNSCCVHPHPSKSYSSGSFTVTSETVSCYSYDRPVNASSGPTGKSPWNSLRRKNGSRNIDHAALGSQTGTLRCSIRNNTQLESSSNSTCKSMPRLSSCRSPASSMNHWSSESSSSSSINNKTSKTSTANMDVSPCKGALFDCHATRSALENYHGASAVSSYVSSHLKPTRLRLPSPRIGYFDWPKSGNRIKNLNGAPNGTIHGEHQPVRTLSGSGNEKHLYPCPAMGTSTSQVCKLKDPFPEVPVISGNNRTRLRMISKAHTSLSLEMRPHNCVKTKEVSRRLNVSSESGLGLTSKLEEKGIRRSLKIRKGVVQSNMQVHLKDNNSGRSKDGPGHAHNRFIAAKNVLKERSPYRLENNHHISYVSGKENLCRYTNIKWMV